MPRQTEAEELAVLRAENNALRAQLAEWQKKGTPKYRLEIYSRRHQRPIRVRDHNTTLLAEIVADLEYELRNGFDVEEGGGWCPLPIGKVAQDHANLSNAAGVIRAKHEVPVRKLQAAADDARRELKAIRAAAKSVVQTYTADEVEDEAPSAA